MKKLTSLLIGCSLMLAGAALAQQAEEQPSPGATAAEKGKGHPAEGKPRPEVKPTVRPEATPAEHHATAAPKQEKVEATPKVAAPTPTAAITPASRPVATPTPAVKSQAEERGNNAKASSPTASITPFATPVPAPKATATVTPAMKPTPSTSTAASATPSATATAAASASPSASASTSPIATASAAPAAVTASPAGPLPTPKPNTAAATKKPDVQKAQEIKTEHANFTAQPSPQVAPPVTFNPSYRVEGSDRWQGPQYEVYRSYRPERHDESYYRSHYDRVELIGGGYYYQHNNYWYPAWGYNPRNEYYAYDGPIYVGNRNERPDRVIADVQAELKDMGYYQGEVDGLLGPLTRKALTGYQDDAGLTTTATIDEPTLDSLNMSR